MRFYNLTAAIALTCALSSAARAADVPPLAIPQPAFSEARGELWKSAPLDTTNKPTATQRQFADAASAEFSVLADLRAWRDTLGGTGKFARRDLISDKNLGLSLGKVAPPTLAGAGGNAGVAAHWGALEVGSTLCPRALDETLNDFDRNLTGEKQALAEAQSVTWLRAKPLAGKDGSLELNLARAARDVAPGEKVQMREGTFMSAGGNVQLPLRWRAEGAWTQANLDENGEDKTRWNAKLGGPIVHPFGAARAEIEWRETDAGYATLGQTDANGGTVGAAKVTQGIKTNLVSGQIRLAAGERARRNLNAARKNDELENSDALGAADLKLKVTPNLSLRANGAVGAAQTKRAGDDFAAALQNANADDATFREQTQTQGGDVGVEWKLNRALSVAASVGNSQTLGWRDEPSSDWTQIGQSAENRLGFEIKHQTGGGVLAAKYAARARDDASLGDWRRLETLRLQAQRPLFFGVKLQATVDLARDGQASWTDENGVARRVEAQLQLSRRSRFDLNYRDGAALPGQWLNDPLSAPFRPTSGGQFASGDREWGARFNAGSAAGGQGLGLAFEYARQAQSGGGNDQWRVGLTWK